MTLIVNPRLLRDDIGWQLSFLAILGLIYLQPLLQKGVMKITANKGKLFFEALNATIAAQIATAPVILYNFGNFSVIAPIANLLVVWVVPVLTITMMASLALTAIFPSLGLFFFLPCWIMVKYIFWIVQILSGLSWAAVEID
jgi:competence protein ComEC